MLKDKYVRATRILMAAALIIALAAFSGCITRKSSPDPDPSPNSTGVRPSAQEPGKPATGGITPKPEPSTLEEIEFPTDDARQGADEPEPYAYEQTQGAQSAALPTVTDPPGQVKRPSATGAKAKLAIVIDDFGYRSEATRRILAIDEPFTCAILPDAKTTAQDGLDAYNAGKLVILHMPMEAIDGSKSEGEGFIRAGMDEATVKSMLSDALGKVPMAEGISNHMGSRVSLDREVLGSVIREARDRGLFYLDSRTTSDTVGPELARKTGAEVYINDIFIDGVDDAEYVKAKLWEAADRALLEGQAVAIGHVKLSTAKALEEVLPKMLEYGVELVFLDELSPIV